MSSLIQEKNNFDSDDDQEVCLGFDLNQMAAMNNTKSALAMASLAQKQDRQIQSSLFKALEFEMQRLNDSNNIVINDGGNESVPNTPLIVSMNKSAEIPKPTDTIVNL